MTSGDFDFAPVPGHELVDAFLDGELVDAGELRDALDSRETRDYLIDALLLRQIARSTDNGSVAVAAPKARGSWRSLRWAAAIAAVIVGTGSGYAYAIHARSTPASTMEVSLDTSAPPPAPSPTREIRFERGVNWTTVEN